MSVKAKQFLEQKLRETIAECHVPALAATLVRDSGDTIVSAQLGIRKVGASGAGNNIKPTDKFNLGSISKVFTAAMIGKLIQGGVGGLRWDTRLVDVYPNLWLAPTVRDAYKNVTIEQMLTHTAGFPFKPVHDTGDDWMLYTPLDMTKAKLKKRRLQYIVASTFDAPSYSPPGSGFEYSGGGVIAASMAEKKTGKTYEDLVKQYIYAPLGMTNSGFGLLSSGALNGPWQHEWEEGARTAKAYSGTQLPGFNWHGRAPVGTACCSAADIGKFMREQLRADPQVFTTDVRLDMHTHEVSTHSDFVRGAWRSSQPGSRSATLSHDGDNGVSYAWMVMWPGHKVGMAAMSNMSSEISRGAVKEMHEVMSAMHEHWSDLFGAGSKPLVECVHPVPAITLSGSTMTLLGRRHDGSVYRYRSTNSGDTWVPNGDFGAVTVNSGLGAAASSDGARVFVIGRVGPGNKACMGRTTNGGSSWQAWAPVRAGVFITGPAIACSANGQVVHAVGIGNNKAMWRTRSLDGGQTWIDWLQIGQGVFTSAPAIATSFDGKIVHVVARGNDMRAWRNVSSDSGTTFQPHWASIGNGIFSSGLGCAVSDDGQYLHVMGRGVDRAMWCNTSSNAGSSWQARWQALSGGGLTSAPSLATSNDGMVLHAYAYGSDFSIRGNRSVDGGEVWSGWSTKVNDLFI